MKLNAVAVLITFKMIFQGFQPIKVNIFTRFANFANKLVLFQIFIMENWKKKKGMNNVFSQEIKLIK